jgi:hypothetical protein
MSGKSFIRAVEVWTPQGDQLSLHSGAYTDETPEPRTFARGEGLPGSAWERAAPVVWERAEPGLAFPLFAGERVVAVVSLACSDDAGGCLEVWAPNDLRELALTAGYYGRLEPFAEISRLLRFQRGRGLPGIVWQTGLPQVIADLRTAGPFIRAAAARTSGVDSGLGIPLFRAGELTQALLFLSAHATPLARAFEVWTLEQGALQLHAFHYAGELGLGISQGMRPAAPPGEALAERVRDGGLPIAQREHGRFQLALGIPVHDGTKLRAVVNLLS